ncbi:hypothetical protein CC80DRAFT_505651 [Byssothecium circinans]|uniref:Uncharacterized protein n=1 Tax=Byssothecium circinans TaxID=147558 RepID=A0A6A5TQV3_9PLEO|nr:hypothetical protein CC80DRAFT_505651 [Byssothecium circinans]
MPLPRGLQEYGGRVVDTVTVVTEHPDDEQIPYGCFPFHEFYGILWNVEYFDPNFGNIYVGNHLGKGHHAKGEGAKDRSTFLGWAPQYVFCLEYYDHPVLGRVRCGQVFLVDSAGCGNKQHGVTDCTGVFKKMNRGQPVYYGDLKDPEVKRLEQLAPPVDAEAVKREQALADPDPIAAFKKIEEDRLITEKTRRQVNKLKTEEERLKAAGKTKEATTLSQRRIRMEGPDQEDANLEANKKLAQLDAKRKGGYNKKQAVGTRRRDKGGWNDKTREEKDVGKDKKKRK